MKTRVLYYIFFVFFCNYSISSEIDLSGKFWEHFDLPNRFPQTIVLSKKLEPVYFETGNNVDRFNKFKKNFVPSKVGVDNVELINAMIHSEKFDVVRDAFSKSNSKYLLINVSISKEIFYCKPCSIQKKYLSTTLMDDTSVLYVNLIR